MSVARKQMESEAAAEIARREVQDAEEKLLEQDTLDLLDMKVESCPENGQEVACLT